MSVTQPALAIAPSRPGNRRRSVHRAPRPRGSDLIWSIAFLVPYAGVFVAFALYPIVYGLWMGSDLSLYAYLIEDPRYARTVINTLIYVGLGVNLKLFLALLLSGFFVRRVWWIKALLVVFILPWALPAVPAYLSFHYMLIGESGLIDSLLRELLGIDGPIWFNHRGLAIGSNVVAYIWKWLPFWTVIFLAARLAIPREIYEAADVDGATGTRRFVHITFPLLANVYLVCTLLSTLWMIGDFTVAYFVSGGAPGMASDVLATLGNRYAFSQAQPPLGVAATLSALPVLVPLVIALIRRVQTSEMQL